jgi:hypothetical protein
VTNDDLRALNVRLLALHSALLDFARREWESTYGPTNPAQLLRLLIDDPHFAWLRPLSGAIAQIEEALDPRAAAVHRREAADANKLFEAVQSLIRSSADPTFHAKYVDVLQRSPDAVIAHAEVVKILSARRGA